MQQQTALQDRIRFAKDHPRRIRTVVRKSQDVMHAQGDELQSVPSSAAASSDGTWESASPRAPPPSGSSAPLPPTHAPPAASAGRGRRAARSTAGAARLSSFPLTSLGSSPDASPSLQPLGPPPPPAGVDEVARLSAPRAASAPPSEAPAAAETKAAVREAPGAAAAAGSAAGGGPQGGTAAAAPPAGEPPALPWIVRSDSLQGSRPLQGLGLRVMHVAAQPPCSAEVALDVGDGRWSMWAMGDVGGSKRHLVRERSRVACSAVLPVHLKALQTICGTPRILTCRRHLDQQRAVASGFVPNLSTLSR